MDIKAEEIQTGSLPGKSRTTERGRRPPRPVLCCPSATASPGCTDWKTSWPASCLNFRRRNGHGPQPRRGQSASSYSANAPTSKKARRSSGRQDRPGPSRQSRCSAASSTRSASRLTQGSDRSDGVPGASRSRPPASSTPTGERARADRASRRSISMISDRPRPTRVDHRRPPDRQDGRSPSIRFINHEGQDVYCL